MIFLLLATGCLLYNSGFVHASCSDDNIRTLNDCYKSEIFDALGWPTDPIQFGLRFIEATLTVDGATQICNTKKSLDKCINSQDIIQSCVNNNDFQRTTFASTKQAARVYVANYVQVDYVCNDDIFKLAMSKLDCVNNMALPVGVSPRDMLSSDCTVQETYMTAAKETSLKVCGAPASCFVQKAQKVERCMFADCDICSTIDITKNPINDLCHDDGTKPDSSGGLIVTTWISMMFAIIFVMLFA